MNALVGLFFFTFILYSIIYDWTFMKLYLIVVAIYYVLTQFQGFHKLNSKRKKMAIATWGEPNDPSIFCTLKIDITNGLEYLEKMRSLTKLLIVVRKETGLNVTITHLVGKAVGFAIKDARHFNGRIFAGNVDLSQKIHLLCFSISQKKTLTYHF
jgi:hypothetical protein